MRIGALAVALGGVLAPELALAANKAQVLVTQENGFARLVLNFPDRLDLPPYKAKVENGILAITFTEEIDLLLPDIAAALPDYVSIARVDPDEKGVRFGLRTTLNVNRMEAGERLFIDLLPANWQGLPPGLPAEIVAQLAQRAQEAAKLAEQMRKAQEAKALKPVAEVRVGRNPTFMRVQFNWNVATKGEFAFEERTGQLRFDWPVPIDLVDLQADLPAEVKVIENSVSPAGSVVTFKMAEGVVPRFYQQSDTEFVVDVDIAHDAGKDDAVELNAAIASGQTAAASDEHAHAEAGEHGAPAGVEAQFPASSQTKLTPFVNMAGATVRLVLPFEQDTPAAVFRRGDTVWMLFDTATQINQPAQAEQLAAITKGFTVMATGDTQVVRLDLSVDRLATLASEGTAWVLSLGDILLGATEPIVLNRRLDGSGDYEMTADLGRPGRVHQFRDPEAGDVLSVITAYPPARAVTRNLDHVDFTALRSVHGLVVKPLNAQVEVEVESKLAVISAEEGLTLSTLDVARTFDLAGEAPKRGGFIDLLAMQQPGGDEMERTRRVLMDAASRVEAGARDKARLDLAQFYLGNRLSHEAIGVLEVLDAELTNKELKTPVRMTLAAAQAMAARPREALTILNSEAMVEEIDALVWRTIAKSEAGDHPGARSDAMAAETIIEGYPSWVKARFFLSAARSAVEAEDSVLSKRYLEMIDFATLEADDVTEFKLISGRIDEAEGRSDEALETYGEVIAADVRPTRAEAVYRTLLMLDQAGTIDLAKATQTLAAEALLWRGNPLEADMQKLLAQLYFRNGDYRLGFETVKQTVEYYPDNKPVERMLAEAQQVFFDLYLNGGADKLDPIDALSLYYDFRNLTPPGARGDEMIRNLVRRLVKVDLLAQAAELLDYQIENRLKGVAQSQVAADLAIIEIADRKPEAALRVLAKTRLPDLAPTLQRQRRVLEARALIDAGRDELALDLVSKLTGRDVDLLRVDAHWKGRRYGVAAELLEVLYSSKPEDVAESQPARMSIIKAAVGFVLAGDQLGLSRLRSKFGDQMAKSAEWPMFDYVTSSIQPTSAEFKKVAQEVAGLDSLNAFLSSYRDIYGEAGAMTPLNATKKQEQEQQS